MLKMHYTEHIQFAPRRAWVVLGPDRVIVSLHTTKGEAEKAATTIRVQNPDMDITFTKCVVLPNFTVTN
jgi:hypothetical protein